ncbi:MAG: type I-E CRISPR-associated protein Cas5/CasD [Bifidobacteriaceae bacterium]|jgi:CRISPR system Cascade subunit CasD|nr:type I-E CRISPR-associated protein Cas5/CasD [Bifidobacteriaceae bacterium]
MTTSPLAALVLRLAGPLQAWGRYSELNRREVASAPTKSGIIGLLAAARGTRRGEPIEDLLCLNLAVRIDSPGSVMRDYHTVSDYRGEPLPSSAVNAKGRQRRTAPPKMIAVTQRFYLQDAVFVAAVQGERSMIHSLAEAIRRPQFPLALGRRSCVPTQPLLLTHPVSGLGSWEEPLVEILRNVPWQGGPHPRQGQEASYNGIQRLPAIVDADASSEGYIEAVTDVPVSFGHLSRSFTSRQVRHFWVDAPAVVDADPGVHGFALLGGI